MERRLKERLWRTARRPAARRTTARQQPARLPAAARGLAAETFHTRAASFSAEFASQMLAIAVAEGRTLYSRFSSAKYQRAASLRTRPESQPFGRDSLSGHGPSAHRPEAQAPGPRPGARARLEPAPSDHIPSTTSSYGPGTSTSRLSASPIRQDRNSPTICTIYYVPAACRE
jgi:hypothetical protein